MRRAFKLPKLNKPLSFHRSLSTVTGTKGLQMEANIKRIDANIDEIRKLLERQHLLIEEHIKKSKQEEEDNIKFLLVLGSGICLVSYAVLISRL